MMPERDGWAVLSEIKADPVNAHLPVIMLTALSSENDQLRAWKLGAADYITKPFNHDVLTTAVADALIPKTQGERARRRREVVERLTRRGRDTTAQVGVTRFANAFDHAPIAMALLSPQGRWLRANQTMDAWLGPNTLRMIDVVHPGDWAAWEAATSRLTSGAEHRADLQQVWRVSAAWGSGPA
jgi:DNA-binding response OmpR family regulator